MALSFSINLDELARLSGFSKKVLEKTQNKRPLMRQLGAIGETQTSERFDTGTAPDGTKWPKSLRVQMNQGGQTLVDSRRLLSSITHFSDANSAMWGTNVKYAAAHNFGAIIRPRKAKRLKFFIPGIGFRSLLQAVLPQREFMGINDDNAEEFGEAIGKYLFGGVQ